MQIAQKLSGFTAGEADILRRAMGKKKRVELEKQKQRFIDGAVKNGIRKDVAANIFLKIEPFAEYGFNKSHAAAYAVIAYQTAYLKTHFPNEFFAASMTLDLSNQNKLSEFYEDLKRLNIKTIRPDINKCYADFRSSNDNFYYALGAIKNVGFEAVKNIVKEREKNGIFKSVNDFVNRVNPNDINKLQLEGLVKSGAFDNITTNRQSIYNSIPNLILKSKNIFENKIANQIDLFEDNNEKNENFLEKIDDWQFEERLSKEFESVGFFISDHPLNQFKEIFEDYNIINFNDFNLNKDITDSNIAATLLKIQEKKTQKGNSYAIIKCTDLSSVFELFIFSDTLELSRDLLIEGNSLIVTLTKNTNDELNRFKRINVKKIVGMKNLLNSPINHVKFRLGNVEKLEELSKKLANKDGKSVVEIEINNLEEKLIFKLKNKRQIDRKSINLIKNNDISAIIN
jgi:DNA polymerase-3 subunit alpha